MGISIEEAREELILNDLFEEQLMKEAAKRQSIYIFVEGDSEELTFQPLLEDCGIDFKTMGIVIANYNGEGNLKHALRLLSNTLSHDRPVIVTYDDDHAGKKLQKPHNPLITYFKIPSTPVVSYDDASSGGSFEESFPKEIFIASCFQENVIDRALVSKRLDFEKMFDPKVPWVSQLKKFILSYGGKPSSINKPQLAENMMISVVDIPETYKELAKQIIFIRNQYPVKHPYDIELKDM